MAKELPYFRFTVQDWQNGKISLESFEHQGLFISVCGYYWINDCDLTLTMLHKKFSNATVLLKELIDLGILKHENRHDKVEIEFLNLQYDLLSEKRKRRQDAGSKGGNAKAMLKQKGSYKDKDKYKKKEKEKDKESVIKKIEMPFSDSLDFHLTWDRWLKFRTEIRKPYKSQETIDAVFKFLSGFTVDVAIKMIEKSITMQWQGIFELNEKELPVVKKEKSATSFPRNDFKEK